MTPMPCSRLLKTSIPDPPALQSPRAPFNSYWTSKRLVHLPPSYMISRITAASSAPSSWQRVTSKSFPKFLDVLQDIQNFDLKKQKATLKHESTVPSGPTILSAITASLLSATRCSIKPCPETGRNTPTAIRATPRHATPTLPVLDAQASMKKAKAVLQYHIADPTNHPKYDTDRLNKYMMFENYSLAATTSSIHPSFSNRRCYPYYQTLASRLRLYLLHYWQHQQDMSIQLEESQTL